MPPTRATLLATGTALPAIRIDQERALRFQERILAALPLLDAERAATRERVRRIYGASGIAARATVIPDYATDDPLEHEFFPPSADFEPFPGTAHRMRAFEIACVPLARDAARQALRRAAIEPQRITHLVLSTCTGLFSPGPDIHLVDALGLAPCVQRTLLGFMGCNAGLNGMRAAAQIIAGEPAAVVLQVAVELCTLHAQKSPDPQVLVAQALFADGAAAAVWSGDTGAERGLATVTRTRSELVPGTRQLMTWHVHDTGFVMQLDRRIPARLARALPGFVEPLTLRSRDQVWGWALHPGGRAIIQAACAALELPAGAADVSLEVLRAHGNLSSATILFILDALLAGARAPGPVVALGFGPGLTLEGVLLEPTP